MNAALDGMFRSYQPFSTAVNPPGQSSAKQVNNDLDTDEEDDDEDEDEDDDDDEDGDDEEEAAAPSVLVVRQPTSFLGLASFRAGMHSQTPERSWLKLLAQQQVRHSTLHVAPSALPAQASLRCI